MLGSILLFVAAALPPAFAQGAPQPTAEHKRLEYFVGKWRGEGDMKASAFGPAGKSVITSTCEWFAGHFHVVCRSESSSPEGTSREVVVLGYDPAKKVYTRYNYGSDGSGSFALGSLDGKTWRWRGALQKEGEGTQFNFAWTETSPDSYVFKVDVREGANTPVTFMEGKVTRGK